MLFELLIQVACILQPFLLLLLQKQVGVQLLLGHCYGVARLLHPGYGLVNRLIQFRVGLFCTGWSTTLGGRANLFRLLPLGNDVESELGRLERPMLLHNFKYIDPMELNDTQFELKTVLIYNPTLKPENRKAL